MKSSFSRLVNWIVLLALFLPAGTPATAFTPGQEVEQVTTVYSILGRVTDGSGNPLEGITIEAALTGVQSDYQPNPDGYQFVNSSGHTSWEIFRDTYGAENVEWTIMGKTIKKPAAQTYYNTTYKKTGSAGNCDGMAISSILLHNNWATPSDFLSQQNVTHTIELLEPPITNSSWLSTPVSDFIIRYQGYQDGKQVQSERSLARGRSLSNTLAMIKQGIDGGLVEPQVIGIYGPIPWENNKCGGHSLMPYAYQTVDQATYISVYDSNHQSDFSFNSNYYSYIEFMELRPQKSYRSLEKWANL